MTCWTNRESRSLSISIRAEKRLTASGSSAASCTASASSRIAPTGVFSSWLTLPTKSRRTASTRRSRVRSSTRASTSRAPSGATRAVTWRAGTPGRAITSSVSRIWPSRRTCWTSVASSTDTSDCPRTSPMAYAGAEALSTVSLSSTTTALLLQDGEDRGDSGGYDGLVGGHRRAVLLAVADVPREHGSAGDDGADDRGEKRLRRRIHVVNRTREFSVRCSGRPWLPNVHPSFTSQPRLDTYPA